MAEAAKTTPQPHSVPIPAEVCPPLQAEHLIDWISPYLLISSAVPSRGALPFSRSRRGLSAAAVLRSCRVKPKLGSLLSPRHGSAAGRRHCQPLPTF